MRVSVKAFEKAEDPIYVLENNIPIDMQWYVVQAVDGGPPGGPHRHQ